MTLTRETEDKHYSSWVEPNLDVRVAGAGTHLLEQLRWSGTYGHIVSARELDFAVSYLRQITNEAFYAFIGTLQSDKVVQQQAVRVKRAMARGSRSWHDAAVALNKEYGLPTKLNELLNELHHAEQDAQSAWELADTNYLTEQRTKAHDLVSIGQQPEIAHGLLSAAPTLKAAVDQVAVSGQVLDAKRAARLASFVGRAVTKTSPYSTFTSTGHGRLDVGGEPPDAVEYPASPVLQLEGKVWALMVADIVANPHFASDVYLRINPSVTKSPDGFEFLGRPPAESLVRLPKMSILADILRSAHRPTTRQHWVDHLHDLQSANESDAYDPVELLDKLIEAGFVTAHVPVSDSSLKPIHELNKWIDMTNKRRQLSYGEDLLRLEEALSGSHQTLGSEAAKDRLNRGEQAARNIVSELGLAGQALADGGVIHESAVLPGGPIDFKIPRIDASMTHLDLTRRWLSIFDTKLPGKIAVEDYAIALFQDLDSVPLLQFYRKIESALKAETDSNNYLLKKYFSALPVQPATDDTDLPADSRLSQLALLRHESRELVRNYTNTKMNIADIPAEAVEQFLAIWPKWLGAPLSAACYVQPTQDDKSSLVVNVIHGGYGRGRARTNYLMRVADPTTAHLNQHTIPGITTAEYSGAHGSSLNVRAATAQAEFDYPYTFTTRPTDELIPMNAVHVQQCADDQGLRLVDKRSGQRVHPVHIGMLADYQLPPLAKFLERVFSDSFLLHPSSPPFASNFDLGSLTSTTVAPRIQVGEVVIQRRRWIIPSDGFPTRRSDETPVRYWARLIQWLDDEGLPSTCFLRAWGTDLAGDKVKARKPMYFDAASWWSISECLRHSQGSDFIVLDEALPDPAHTNAPQFVQEALLEMWSA